MPSAARQASAVGVDRLQPGDHAFLAFSDDEERWGILSVFTQQGLARGEKVLLHVAVADGTERVAARVAGGTAAARRATGRGQLVVSDTPAFGTGGSGAAGGAGGSGAAGAEWLADAARRLADAVVGEGYSGLRSATEMSLALTPPDSLDQAVEFETALHESLYAAGSRRYTSLCQWDERELRDGPVLDAVRALHPVTLLDRDGTLHATVTETGIRLTGDSDLSTRAEFTAALRLLAGQQADTLVLDIADLSFLDARSTCAVLRFAAGLVWPRRLEVRCRNHHRRMLHLLGGRSIRQLSVVTGRLC